MRTTKLILGLIVGLAACGGKGSDSDSDTSSGGGSSSGSSGEAPTTSGSTGDGTTATTGSMTASSDPTTGPSQTASSDPTTGPAPTTGGTDPGATTGETGDSTTGDSTDETGAQPINFAVAENDCAPNDGAAVAIRLEVIEAVCGVGSPGEDLRVVVYQGAPLPVGTYVLGNDIGHAMLAIGANQPLFSNEGSITIESFAGDTVTGTYELTFPDDTMRAGAFSGPFCETNPMCG